MNTERILQLADAIEKRAFANLKFDLNNYISRTPECGAAGCLAGWCGAIGALEDGFVGVGSTAGDLMELRTFASEWIDRNAPAPYDEANEEERLRWYDDDELHIYGREWLGLTRQKAEDLFTPHQDPNNDGSNVYRISDIQVAALLRTLAATGEIVWPKVPAI